MFRSIQTMKSFGILDEYTRAQGMKDLSELQGRP